MLYTQYVCISSSIYDSLLGCVHLMVPITQANVLLVNSRQQDKVRSEFYFKTCTVFFNSLTTCWISLDCYLNFA